MSLALTNWVWAGVTLNHFQAWAWKDNDNFLLHFFAFLWSVRIRISPSSLLSLGPIPNTYETDLNPTHSLNWSCLIPLQTVRKINVVCHWVWGCLLHSIIGTMANTVQFTKLFWTFISSSVKWGHQVLNIIIKVLNLFSAPHNRGLWPILTVTEAKHTRVKYYKALKKELDWEMLTPSNNGLGVVSVDSGSEVPCGAEG